MGTNSTIVPAARIQESIYWIRGQKVMLSTDLAELYDVSVKVLNQAVKRNAERFPEDFMFQLTRQELTHSRSQIVTLNGQFKVVFEALRQLMAEPASSPKQIGFHVRERRAAYRIGRNGR